MQESLKSALVDAHVASNLIDAAIDSGYYLRNWVEPFSGRTWTTVSDMMYGNKQFSSSFDLADFTKYINRRHAFESLPGFTTYEARDLKDIEGILADSRRSHYREEGSFTFRGQPREYKFKRKIPNPVRADEDGYELSVMPGAYRQREEFYSFAIQPREERSFEFLLRELEPNNPDIELDAPYAYDVMRTEQHYATQTAGLDLSFEIETALFFATHQFKWDTDNLAFYQEVNPGEHTGVIYCFRFIDPPVKKTQYLIREFDLFRTFPPSRILRQDCGLPLFMQSERNIAITDIDCIIKLASDFKVPNNSTIRSPEYMFPSAAHDKFYGKLLGIKDKKPELLSKVVEYKWAREE